jgi:hypothetical protein
MTQNKNPFQKNCAALVAIVVFVCSISLLFALKTALFVTKYIIVLAKYGNSSW